MIKTRELPKPIRSMGLIRGSNNLLNPGTKEQMLQHSQSKRLRYWVSLVINTGACSWLNLHAWTNTDSSTHKEFTVVYFAVVYHTIRPIKSIKNLSNLSLISVMCSCSQLEVEASTTWFMARLLMQEVKTRCTMNADTVPTNRRPL